MTTNLFDCTKIIEDLSTIEYYPSSNSLGVVAFPGGHFSNSLFGTIGDWGSSKRQVVAKISCQLKDAVTGDFSYLFSKSELFLINTNDYDRSNSSAVSDKRIVSNTLYTQTEYVSKKFKLTIIYGEQVVLDEKFKLIVI